MSTLSESSGLDDTPGAKDTADDKKVNGDDDNSNATAATDVADADAATEADTAAADSDADPFAALDAAADSADAAAFDAVAPAVDDTYVVVCLFAYTRTTAFFVFLLSYLFACLFSAKSTPEVEPVVPLHLFKGVDDDGDRLITQALIVGNFEAAVDLCIRQVSWTCPTCCIKIRKNKSFTRTEPIIELLVGSYC